MVWSTTGRYSFVCFTLHVAEGEGIEDPDPEEIFEALVDADCSVIAGLERGLNYEGLHYQGYAEAPSNFTTQRWNRLLPHASFRRADGSGEENETYCSKDGFVWSVWGNTSLEEGVWRNKGRKGQGKRNDLDAFIGHVRKGAPDVELYEDCGPAMVKYPGAVARIRSAFAKPRTELPCIRILWGVTGTGKSHQALKVDLGEKVRFRFPFLIGYTGTNSVTVLDEFRWKSCDIEDMLELLDEHRMPVECKNGVIFFNSTVIYICSNTDPATWWPDAPAEQRDAIHRRITDGEGCVKHCVTQYVKGVATPSLFEKWAGLT